MQRTIGLSEQLLSLQLPIPGNFLTLLRLVSNWLFLIVLMCFLYASITFFDIHQLLFRQEPQVLQEYQ